MVLPGYMHKPAWSYILSACYLVLPVLTFLHISFQQGISIDLRTSLDSHIMMQDIFCSIVAAIAVFVVSRLSLFFLFALSIYVVGIKLIHIHLGGWVPSMEWLVIWFWFLAPFIFLTTSLRIPYLDPNARLWKRPLRYSHQSQATMYFGEVKFPVNVVNLSEQGAFIRLDMKGMKLVESEKNDKNKTKGEFVHPFMSNEDNLTALSSIKNYPKFKDIVRLVVQTFPESDLSEVGGYYEVKAQVVWTTKITDPMKHGLGLQFVNQSWSEKRKLSKYLQFITSKKHA